MNLYRVMISFPAIVSGDATSGYVGMSVLHIVTASSEGAVRSAIYALSGRHGTVGVEIESIEWLGPA